MALCSVPFIIFCVLLLIAYYLAPKKYQWLVLLAASIVFNAFCGAGAVVLLILFAFATYLSSNMIGRIFDKSDKYIAANKETLPKEERKKHKEQTKGKAKKILVAYIILLVACLAFFKLLPVFDKFGMSFTILAPLGVSYYTLQCIGYVTDVYRRAVIPEKNYFKVLLFVSFFPQIVQGPISEWEKLTGEIFAEHGFSAKSFSYGFYRLLWGFFKKMVIADTFSAAAGWGYANTASATSADMLLTALFYTFEIYFDFSGYTDMAIGISSMLNIDLPMNFDSPYKAVSIRDFWKRWHMSLTRFLTEYIYFPLGGSRRGTVRTYVNIMIVFLISGLWHGANWTFILWGALHGPLQVVERLMGKAFDRIAKPVRWLYSFISVSILWLLFGAESITQWKDMLSTAFTFNSMSVSDGILKAFMLPEIS
ncbi:MAG: MBOAT family protein, partial [Lachnospiraceae bacterium]|nr:MBOAT family protein [Lachnospiraceae bacterium]